MASLPDDDFRASSSVEQSNTVSRNHPPDIRKVSRFVLNGTAYELAGAYPVSMSYGMSRIRRGA